MNSVALTGRLTRDPEVRYSAGNSMAIAKFTLAVDRQRTAREGEQTADFISITCFGKTAELVEKYVSKGQQIGVTGRIQTGSYEKDGRKVYTTEVLADRVEFLDRGDKSGGSAAQMGGAPAENQVPAGFTEMTDDDIPF